MSVSVSDGSSVSDPKAVKSLKILLDCAIAAGTELEPPIFVGPLRMANLELAKGGRATRPRALRGTEARVAP